MGVDLVLLLLVGFAEMESFRAPDIAPASRPIAMCMTLLCRAFVVMGLFVSTSFS